MIKKFLGNKALNMVMRIFNNELTEIKTGVTDISNGGTGKTTAEDARSALGIGNMRCYQGRCNSKVISGDLVKYNVTADMTINELWTALPNQTYWIIYFNSQNCTLNSDMPVTTGGMLEVYKNDATRGLLRFTNYRDGYIYTSTVFENIDIKWISNYSPEYNGNQYTTLTEFVKDMAADIRPKQGRFKDISEDHTFGKYFNSELVWFDYWLIPQDKYGTENQMELRGMIWPYKGEDIDDYSKDPALNIFFVSIRSKNLSEPRLHIVAKLKGDKSVDFVPASKVITSIDELKKVNEPGYVVDASVVKQLLDMISK